MAGDHAKEVLLPAMNGKGSPKCDTSWRTMWRRQRLKSRIRPCQGRLRTRIPTWISKGKSRRFASPFIPLYYMCTVADNISGYNAVPPCSSTYQISYTTIELLGRRLGEEQKREMRQKESFEPGSNQRPQDCGILLQSRALPTELSKAYLRMVQTLHSHDYSHV